MGQVLDGDAQHGAAQDGQLAVPVGEPAAVAVDQGVDLAPGIDADRAVERGACQGEGLHRFELAWPGRLRR